MNLIGKISPDATAFLSFVNKISYKIHQVSQGYRASYGNVIFVFDLANFPISTSILPIHCGALDFPFAFSGKDFTDPLKLDPYDGISNPSQYLRYVAEHFAGHPFFIENLEVRFLYFDNVANQGAIEIIAKTIGSDFQLSYSTPTDLPLNAATRSVLAVNGVYPSRLTLRLTLSCLVDGLYNPMTHKLDPIFSNGTIDKTTDTATFDFYDLTNLVRPFLGVDIPHCIWSAFILRYNLARISYQTSTFKDGVESIGITPVFESVFVNISAPLGSNINDLFAVSDSELIFVSTQNHKRSSLSSLEWLVCNIVEDLIHNLIFTVFYEDGTSSTKSLTLFYNFDVPVAIPTGFSQNFLANLAPHKTPTHYTVTIGVSGLFQSDPFTYFLDNRYFSYWKQFVFQNAFGVPDSITLHGAAKTNSKFKRTNYQLALDDSVTQATGTWHTSSSSYYDEITYRSGWLLSKQELDRWKEFLSSQYIGLVPDDLSLCEFTDEGYPTNIPMQPYTKMLVVSDSIEIIEESDFLFSLQFALRPAFENSNNMGLKLTPPLYYDSEIEFIISKQDPLDINVGEVIIFVSTDIDGYFSILVNGEDIGGNGSIFIVENKVYHIVIKAYRLNEVSLAGLFTEMVISIPKIDSFDLRILAILFFSHSLEAFFQRLERLWNLDTLVIGSTYYLDVDRALTQCVKLKQEGGMLNTINFGSYTPSALGYKLKDVLVNQYSSTVITL